MRAELLFEELSRRGLEARLLRRGPIRGVEDYEVLSRGRHVAYLRLFRGRPPFYRAWVEVYGVDWSMRREAEALVEAAAAALEERGERVFVEYAGLEDVDRLLARGVEPGETWLGRLLARRGLKVRDMYYPEGFMEGGPKLVGELL